MTAPMKPQVHTDGLSKHFSDLWTIVTGRHAMWSKKLALGVMIGGTLLLSACGGQPSTAIIVTPPSATATPPSATATPNVPTPTPKRTSEEIADLLRPSTVLVHAEFPKTAVDDAALGAGTGIVFTDDGYIMTNAHVVEGASSVTISVDGNTHQRAARVVGISSCDDLAVLKVDNTDGLKPAKLGHSGTLKRGEQIYALGYPESFDTNEDMSITQGIVSKLDVALGSYESLVQVDAAINHGNSGGPLVNEYGEVVGINTLGLDPTQATNINYAISLDQAHDIVEQLKQGHKPEWLGMNLVPNDYAKYFGTEDGLVVAAVDSGSPAAKVGIPPAALLLQLEGSDVNSKADVCKILRSHTDGDKLSVTLYYPGETKNWQLDGEIALGQPDANTEKLQATEIPSTPAPTPTEAPVTFQDDFSTDTGNWLVGSNDTSETTINNGTYNISFKQAGIYTIRTASTVATSADMAVIADVQVDGNARAGLAVRHSKQGETRSFYACWIDGNSHYGCFVTVNDQLTTLTEATKSDAIKPGQMNQVALIAEGSQITLKVNGTDVATFNDTRLTSGVPALYAENFESVASASFDNVQVIQSTH